MESIDLAATRARKASVGPSVTYQTGTRPPGRGSCPAMWLQTGTMTSRARIAMIEDDAILAELVRELLEGDGFSVATCSHWEDALPFVRREQPDLVMLDLRLGDAEHGWRVLDHLTLDRATRHIPVILCSGAHESLHGRAPALLPQHGVFVLPKPFDLATLLETVAGALTGHPPVARLASGRPPQPSRGRTYSGPLTRREQEIATLIARGYTNKQIALELVLTPGTVANHVGHMLGKLGCSSRVQIAMWASAAGLLQPSAHAQVALAASPPLRMSSAPERDGERLEQAACEDYRLTRQIYERMYAVRRTDADT